MTINAFHPDFIKTHMPEFMANFRAHAKASESGKISGAMARTRESIPDKPDRNTISSFPKTKPVAKQIKPLGMELFS